MKCSNATLFQRALLKLIYNRCADYFFFKINTNTSVPEYSFGVRKLTFHIFSNRFIY